MAAIAVLIGVLIAASVAVRAALHRLRIPPLVGYLVLGMLLRAGSDPWSSFESDEFQALELLGELGVIALLFRIGLEAKLSGLVRQLRTAWIVWTGDVAVSALAGFAAARWLLGLELAPSLVIATGLTATSAAVSSAVWESCGKLDTPDGQRVLDVAELDDISGVVLLALLFAMLPGLQAPEQGSLLSAVSDAALSTAIRFALFAVACFGFARYAEPRITELCKRLPGSPDRMLTVVSIGIVIAGAAELSGLSVAIGAFFAGLAFSRDARAIRIEASFEPVYELVTPFFFLSLGFGMAPQSIAAAGLTAVVLLLAAIVGKVLGAGGAALVSLPLSTAAVIGVSMIPRAEIGLLIIDRGHRMGAWAVSDSLYSAMIFVAAGTCLIGPLLLSRMLR